MTRDPEREDIFKWVGPISDNTKYLFRMKHREDIQVKSLQDATDYLVGAIRDGSMSHLLLANGFNEGKNLDLVADKATNTRRLFANRVGLVANTKLGMAYQAQIQGFNANDLAVAFAFPEGGGYYLAFSAQTSDKIMVRFRQALDKLKREGKLDEITAHYYSGLLYSQLPQ